MKTKFSFSARPFSLLLAAAFLAVPIGAHAADSFEFSNSSSSQAPVGGGFAPTQLSGSSMGSSDDMTGGIVASALPPQQQNGNSYQANLEVRLSDLENQMRSMRGQLEEKDHQISQLKNQLDRALSDIDMRLNQGSPASSGSSSGMGGGATSPYPSSPDMPPQPDNSSNPNAPAPATSSTQRNLGTLSESGGGTDVAREYESAYAKLKSGDYVAAQADFARFLKAHPDHQLAGNATYWYGETFYAQQKYNDASRIFADSYKKYPKGPKAADSLLKLGMSLGGAGKTKEACMSFGQIKKQFPVGNSTVLNRANQEMAKLSCS